MVHSEEQHRDCFALFRELLETGRTIKTTNYVVMETTALLQHRIGINPVRDFDERIVPLIAVHWVSADLHRKGIRRLLRENKRTLSLTDCVSFEFMESEGLRDVFSLDRRFAEAGFRLLARRGR